MKAHPDSLTRNRSALGHAEFAGQLLICPSAHPAWQAVISSTSRPMSAPIAAAVHSAGAPAPTTVVVVAGVVVVGEVVAGGAVVGVVVLPARWLVLRPDPERRLRLRTGDAVDLEPVTGLVVAHRRFGSRPVRAVGGDRIALGDQRRLQLHDAVTGGLRSDDLGRTRQRRRRARRRRTPPCRSTSPTRRVPRRTSPGSSRRGPIPSS